MSWRKAFFRFVLVEEDPYFARELLGGIALWTTVTLGVGSGAGFYAILGGAYYLTLLVFGSLSAALLARAIESGQLGYLWLAPASRREMSLYRFLGHLLPMVVLFMLPPLYLELAVYLGFSVAATFEVFALLASTLVLYLGIASFLATTLRSALPSFVTFFLVMLLLPSFIATSNQAGSLATYVLQGAGNSILQEGTISTISTVVALQIPIGVILLFLSYEALVHSDLRAGR